MNLSLIVRLKKLFLTVHFVDFCWGQTHFNRLNFKLRGKFGRVCSVLHNRSAASVAHATPQWQQEKSADIYIIKPLHYMPVFAV
jgi:hypothetical protein